MAKAIIDRFEIIKIKIEHAKANAIDSEIFNHRLEPTCKTHAIGQAGEGIRFSGFFAGNLRQDAIDEQQ